MVDTVMRVFGAIGLIAIISVTITAMVGKIKELHCHEWSKWEKIGGSQQERHCNICGLYQMRSMWTGRAQ